MLPWRGTAKPVTKQTISRIGLCNSASGGTRAIWLRVQTKHGPKFVVLRWFPLQDHQAPSQNPPGYDSLAQPLFRPAAPLGAYLGSLAAPNIQQLKTETRQFPDAKQRGRSAISENCPSTPPPHQLTWNLTFGGGSWKTIFLLLGLNVRCPVNCCWAALRSPAKSD